MKHQIIKNTSNKYDPRDSNALGYMQANRLKPLRAKFARAIKTIGLKYSRRFPPRISINTVNAEKKPGDIILEPVMRDFGPSSVINRFATNNAWIVNSQGRLVNMKDVFPHIETNSLDIVILPSAILPHTFKELVEIFKVHFEIPKLSIAFEIQGPQFVLKKELKDDTRLLKSTWYFTNDKYNGFILISSSLDTVYSISINMDGTVEGIKPADRSLRNLTKMRVVTPPGATSSSWWFKKPDTRSSALSVSNERASGTVRIETKKVITIYKNDQIYAVFTIDFMIPDFEWDVDNTEASIHRHDTVILYSASANTETKINLIKNKVQIMINKSGIKHRLVLQPAEYTLTVLQFLPPPRPVGNPNPRRRQLGLVVPGPHTKN